MFLEDSSKALPKPKYARGFTEIHTMSFPESNSIINDSPQIFDK